MRTFGQCLRTALALLAGAALLALQPTPSSAQDLSGRPIRMLVGLAAGGATDVMARIVAQKMSEGLHTDGPGREQGRRQFHSRPCASSPQSPPDGHTLFFISTSTLITQPLHPDYPFDLTKLTPVCQVATGPLILVVRKDLADQEHSRSGRLRQGQSRQAQLRGRRRDRKLALFRHRAVEVEDRDHRRHHSVPGRRTRAQRSAGRPYRRDVRRHAGDGKCRSRPARSPRSR